MEELTNEQMLAEVQEPAPAVEPAAAPAQPAPAVEPSQQYLDFDQYKDHHVRYTANGKEVTEPYSAMVRRAQQGYNHRESMEQIRVEQEYKQYDDFARENPAWGDHIKSAWETRNAYVGDADPEDPATQQLAKFQNVLDSLTSRLDASDKSAKESAAEAERTEFLAQLDKDVDAVRSKYKTFDFNAADDDGVTAESKVYAAMEKHGGSFRANFLDLYEDKLFSNVATQAREETAKATQKQTKQGILGISSTPGSAPAKPSSRSMKQMGWDELGDLAKKEMGT